LSEFKSKIGQGCMGLGGEFTRDYSNEKEQIAAISLGIELGLTFLDTAEVYGDGLSEEMIGKIARGQRESIFISTKFSPENSSFRSVLDAADRSLKRLGTDYIDLYQPHWPNPNVAIEETFEALNLLQIKGKIRNIGVSNFSKKEMISTEVNFIQGSLFSNQVEYNLFDRFIENDILPYCEKNGVYVIAYSPLDKGRSASFDKRHEILNEMANKYEKTTSQIALNWLISRGSVIVIPKSSNPIHIRENAAAGNFQLEVSDLEKIGEVCSAQPILISPRSIKVSLKGEGNRLVYQTIEEAIKNDLGLSPSPIELAEDIVNGEPVKPVRVKPLKESIDGIDFELIEGRLRYWAWVIAFKWEKDIPVYVRYD
jgi:diketogulonate reductase-like aldo/keto reductase